MAPATGIMLADYHVVRKRKLRVNELYVGNETSHYWFRSGVNWRAFVAFFAGTWPLLRTYSAFCTCSSTWLTGTAGLAASVNSYSGPNWDRWIELYNLTFIVGLAISFVVFSALCYFFPVSGLGVDTPFREDADILDGQTAAQDGSSQVITADTKV